jgi:DNA processing protein
MQVKKIYKDQYPYLLRQITQLPISMDIIGDMPGDENKFLCVIGSRLHSLYGIDVCKKIIQGLAGYPIIIVSGLAVGIDSAAHEAAIDAGLKTISFPGSGLSPAVLYPRSKRRLAQRIVDEGGALISKFPYDQGIFDWTFPARNRLMAGIAHAVLIVEGGEGSGTLGTAQYAVDFNRDVCAVPGSIFSPLSYGPHKLIREGATPVTCSEDVLQALGFDTYLTNSDGHNIPNYAELDLSATQRKIISHLEREPLSATELVLKTSLNITEISIDLSKLEIKQLITEREGKYRIPVKEIVKRGVHK